MAKDKERELARELFLHTEMQQKEIASKVGVTEATLSNWAKEEEWDNLKLAHQTSNTEAIADLRELIRQQVKHMRDLRTEGRLTASDTDQLKKLTSSLDDLEKEIPLRMYVQIMEEFTDWIPNTESKFKIKLADMQIKFLLQKAKR